MTLDDLVRLYEEHRNCVKLDPKAHAMRVVVKALRDHIAPLSLAGKTFEVHDLLVEFNEILASEGEKVAVTIKETAVGAVLRMEAGDPPIPPPITDPAPAVCEITAERDRLKAALEALLVAVTYAAPPTLKFGEDAGLCYDARVPDDFVIIARKALGDAS